MMTVSTLALTLLRSGRITKSFKERGVLPERVFANRRQYSLAYDLDVIRNDVHYERKMRTMAMIVPRRPRTPLDMFLSDPFDTFFGHAPVQQSTPNLMRTDIKDCDDRIEIVIDLPGFDKQNVTAELKEGMLTVTAHTETESEEAEGTYVRKERFTGRCSRSFYVGEDIEESDIKARFDNGTLQVTVPKKVEQPKLEEPRTIAIEG